MLNDGNPHVALAAIDAVGEACRGDDVATLRIVSEARTPPNKGSWHREAHALVALARLSPSHAEIPLRSQARHTVWQVRMYAARAAAVLNDVQTLERLAEDDNDNVREATLAPLKGLKGNAAEPHFIAALARGDYQLLLTAATESKGLGPSRALTTALTEALRRVTAHRKETSRDTRLALVQRLREIGTPDVHNGLISLLRDFDPKVATAAADAMTALTAGVYSADPQLLPLQALPNAAEIATLTTQQAVLVMETGKNIELQFDPDVAPMTAVRFLRLSNANYFDGLTFHRVVPNFVVQGGSPGANEYRGTARFSGMNSAPGRTPVAPSASRPGAATPVTRRSSSISSTIRGWISTTRSSEKCQAPRSPESTKSSKATSSATSGGCREDHRRYKR